MTAKHSPMFQLGLQAIMDGNILIPPLRAYLANPEFKGFDIKVRGVGGRKPDYWFHPSEHPSWEPRALWLWMVAPSLLETEPLEPSAILAMTAGSIWHAIIERSLLDLDLLLMNEVKLEDSSSKSRGSADGLLKAGDELMEFKTMKDLRLRKIETVENFIAMYPTYYLQAQEYMRMSGIQAMRFLLMALTFPFEMREFVVPYDHFVAQATADKYRNILQCIADGDVPMCSACPKKQFCPARAVCVSATADQIKQWMEAARVTGTNRN